MFGSIGWGEMMILLVAALVILGPDRLPGAITWVTKSIKQVKEYASGASQQLKDELGTDFEDFRQPLADLNKLRGMTPRAAITKHLLDGDDSIFTSTRDALQNGANSLKDSTSLKPKTPAPEIKIPPAPVGAAASTAASSTADVSLTKSDIPSTRADSDIFAEPAAPAEPSSPAAPSEPSTPAASSVPSTPAAPSEQVSTVKPVSPGGPSPQPMPAPEPSSSYDDAT